MLNLNKKERHYFSGEKKGPIQGELVFLERVVDFLHPFHLFPPNQTYASSVACPRSPQASMWLVSKVQVKTTLCPWVSSVTPRESTSLKSTRVMSVRDWLENR